MTTRHRIILGVLWALSLVAVARLTGTAQAPQQLGLEVRFLPGQGKPGTPGGILVANFNGQWLPVRLEEKLPDANGIFP